MEKNMHKFKKKHFQMGSSHPLHKMQTSDMALTGEAMNSESAVQYSVLLGPII